MKAKTGVIHGRFQMLHIGHMEYLLEGKSRCDYLLIGITNPDASMTRYSAANPHRAKTISNPLTYFERFLMIQEAMLEAGLSKSEFDIVPFPINVPEILFNYVPLDAKFFMTIYDEWSREKYDQLKALGCDIEIMWTRTNDEKVTSGTEIRNRIMQGLEWKPLVPASVYTYIINNGIDVRISKMKENDLTP